MGARHRHGGGACAEELMTDESFVEKVNGFIKPGATVMARINGERFECTYVRAMLARPHRCVVSWSFKPGWIQRFTVSTRKVAPV
jgi:hypothetical protein